MFPHHLDFPTPSHPQSPPAAVVGRVPCPNVLYPSTYASAAVSGGEWCVLCRGEALVSPERKLGEQRGKAGKVW